AGACRRRRARGAAPPRSKSRRHIGLSSGGDRSMTANRTRILHREPRRDLPVAVGGDGPFVIDAAGKRYLDASGGAAVSCLGHSERRVIEAIKAQLDRIPYAHTGFFTNEAAEALADHLVARAPQDLGHVYFVSGGSEANETA